MAKPKPFSGKMDEMELFINACWMFICGHPNDFPSERTAIMWAVSYMNRGSACEWRDDYLEDAKEGNYRYDTLQAFLNTVQEEFGDPDRRLTKIYKLRTIMQGDKTADEHVQSFKKAARGSGYSGYALMEEFKCSLNARLRERVSNLDRIPETIDGWYQQSMHLDRQWRRAKKKAKYYSKMMQSAKVQPRDEQGRYNPKLLASNETAAAPAKAPDAMDVDKNQRCGLPGDKRPPLICFKCRKPGHMARDCRQKLDVRNMTYNEIIAYVKDFSEKKDFPKESK